MSTAEIILVSVAGGVAATVVFLGLAFLVVWRCVPGLRLRVQRFFLSSPGGGPGVFDEKITALEKRLSSVHDSVQRQAKQLEREIEAGKRAEAAMVDIMKGLTRSALRTNERLSAVEREEP